MRLDRSLLGSPLAAIQDVQANGRNNPESAELWEAHLVRMYRRAAGAKAVGPHVQVALQDPYAFRYMALLIFFVGMIFGSLYILSGGARAPVTVAMSDPC